MRELYAYADGLRDARKIVRDTRGLMKGQSGDYVRGWRAALKQVENLLTIRLNEQARKG